MGLPRVQITIGQMMAVTLVVALALAPIPYNLRSPTKESIVATGAYEIIFLPVLTSLIVLGVMKPGGARIQVITVLSLMPLIVVLVSVGSVYAFELFRIAIRPGAIQRLWPLIFWVFFSIVGRVVTRRLGRCPNCQSRNLRPLSRQMSETKMWTFTGEFRCGQCGRSCRRLRSWSHLPYMVDSEPGSIPPS